MQSETQTSRPVVFDYEDPANFFRDLGEYYRKTRRGFSVRSRSKDTSGCSPALISQVLNGQRKLKRDQLLNFAKVFALSSTEINFVDELLKSDQVEFSVGDSESSQVSFKPKVPKNHLLADWLHPYVKDLVELKNFKLDTKWIVQHLGGIANLARIEKSVQFLLREGFWRQTPQGKVVLEESAAVTTNEIPNEKIKNFHKQALKIAAKGLEELPIHRRKASTILVAVNADTRDELRAMINKFQNDLTTFIEKHPANKDELVQVAIHMTPIGGQHAQS
jgi:uncharacterized protein (TIGR02147 family)